MRSGTNLSAHKLRARNRDHIYFFKVLTIPQLFFKKAKAGPCIRCRLVSDTNSRNDETLRLKRLTDVRLPSRYSRHLEIVQILSTRAGKYLRYYEGQLN